MSSSPLKIEPVARVQEPSMEEILASIRKIISDDDSKPAQAAAAAPLATQPVPEPEPLPQAQDDIDSLLNEFEPEEVGHAGILELTEDMVASDPGGLSDADLDFVEPAQAYDPPPAPPVAKEPPAITTERLFASAPQAPEPSAPQRALFDERLLSAATDSAIAGAFGSLTHTILSQNARTLDDLVQDMLRPMLKTWLDDNLPSLVERLVRSEIERVSRGGR
jgi:cell pole-organizing protein PopZ